MLPASHRHVGGMADDTDGRGQTVEVMETVVVARESGHVLGPRGEDEQGAGGTGLKTATLGFPIRTNRVGLHVYQA